MADLKHLDDEMKKAGRRVADNADRLVRRCALAIDTAVVLATPVDTGRARANWQVEIGQAPTGEVDAKDVSGQTAIQQGKVAIEGYKSGSAIFITNNLPYIERLNDGWSKQAPAGFVEQAVQVGVNAVIAEAAKIVDGEVQEKPT